MDSMNGKVSLSDLLRLKAQVEAEIGAPVIHLVCNPAEQENLERIALEHAIDGRNPYPGNISVVVGVQIHSLDGIPRDVVVTFKTDEGFRNFIDAVTICCEVFKLTEAQAVDACMRAMANKEAGKK